MIPRAPRETSVPGLGRHVGERVLATDEPVLLLAVLLARQVVLVDAVETLRLVLVTSDAVLNLLRSVAEEVVRLTLHRTDATLAAEASAENDVFSVALNAISLGGRTETVDRCTHMKKIHEIISASRSLSSKWNWNLVSYSLARYIKMAALSNTRKGGLNSRLSRSCSFKCLLSSGESGADWQVGRRACLPPECGRSGSPLRTIRISVWQ